MTYWDATVIFSWDIDVSNAINHPYGLMIYRIKKKEVIFGMVYCCSANITDAYLQTS
jgi:hypothetical protein